MEPNPYESPKTAPPQRLPPEGTPSVVRRGIPLAIGIAWNIPLLAILVSAFRGSISERTMERAMAGWSLVIPISCLALLFVPWLRRCVFVPDANMAVVRPKLWSLALLWLAILVFWVISDLVRGG